MNRVFFAVLFLLASVTVVAGRVHASARPAKTGAFPVTIVDDRHDHVRIRKEPKRIVSLFPRDTETLFALGLEKRVLGDGGQYVEGAVGITNAKGDPRDFKYPSEWPSKLGRDYPIRAKTITHVEGGFRNTAFNLETIESVRPDLVIWPYADQTEQDVLDKLHNLGLTVITISPRNFKGILNDITILGRATGTSAQAKLVVASMQKTLNATKKALSRVKSRPRVYYELDGSVPGTLYTVGPNTYIDEAIHTAGGTNITHDASQQYPSISYEDLVAKNPQVIVFSIYERLFSSITADTIKSRTGWSSVAAVANNRVYEFNDDLLSRGGPRNAIGIQVLAKLLHPEAFKKR